ncbi:MAG: hypothetical protein R3C26_12640 [Calditrichia bacterium]
MILSTSHCVAKGVRTPPNALHISYLHTPMRYVWDMPKIILAQIKPAGCRGKSSRFCQLFADVGRASANRVDHFLANSAHVGRRIAKYYRRPSTTRFTRPVDTTQFPLSSATGDFYLMITALVHLTKSGFGDSRVQPKRQTAAHRRRSGKSGTAETCEQQCAFFDWVSDAELRNFAAECKALIFPAKKILASFSGSAKLRKTGRCPRSRRRAGNGDRLRRQQ